MFYSSLKMIKLILLLVVCLYVVVVSTKNSFSDTELVYSLVVWRHGDRTPVEEELEVYVNRPYVNGTYFPDGLGALTKSGKRRAYSVGWFLSDRYDGFVSRMYLPDEVQLRATSVPRTQMSALLAMASFYKPEREQRWTDIDGLVWQPVPYTMENLETDDLEPFYNCDRLLVLLADSLTGAAATALTAKYSDEFALLSKYSGYTIQSAYQVVMLKGAISAQKSYGIKQPKWVEKYWDLMTEIENKGFGLYTNSKEMLQLGVGTLLYNFINATSVIISGEVPSPSKLQLVSVHDTNVAALLAAVAFGGTLPFRPKYSGTFALELRRHIKSGKYGVATVYAPEGGYEPAEVIKIVGCEGQIVCPYEVFIDIVSDYVVTDYQAACAT